MTKGKGKKSAAVNAAVAAVAAKRGVSVATGPSRSRSASEMPTPAEPKVKPPPPPQLEEEEASEEEVVDDKLYCICKTSYDEDKVMIACDRYVLPHHYIENARYNRPAQVRRVVSHAVLEHQRPGGRPHRPVRLPALRYG